MAERYPTAPQVVDPLVETLSEVKSDTRELETMISRLGEIVELPVSVPRYVTFHTSILATGKESSDPGGLYAPSGVAIHEETHQIFVANLTELRYSLRRESSSISSV